jgi:hypothetical protein
MQRIAAAHAEGIPVRKALAMLAVSALYVLALFFLVGRIQ